MTILIVEVAADTRKIYRDALEDQGTRRAGGAGGRGCLARSILRPDLILMDILMPIMDGWRALRYLKSDSATERIPIFGISAYASPEEP